MWALYVELGVLGNRVLQISITIHILDLASLYLCHPNLKISLFSLSFCCDQNRENAYLPAKLNLPVVCLQLAAGALAVDLNRISVKCRSMHFVTSKIQQLLHYRSFPGTLQKPKTHVLYFIHIRLKYICLNYGL